MPVSRPPLEQLIYSLVPSLAPVRGTRTDDPKEKERRESVAEMMEWCQKILDRSVLSRRRRLVVRADILNSNLPSSTPLSAETLPETVKRMIYAYTSSGAKEGGAEKALKFNAIWNKLERGKLLSSPNPHLELLAALSPINPNNASRSTVAGSSKSPKNMPPPTFPSTKPSSSRQPLVDAVPNISLLGFDAKGKAKADIINQWRANRSQPPFPQHLLLRDTLYLLQGIDGRYVHFAVSPPKEQNPYLTERGREGEGTGFPLGKEGPIIEEGYDDEVVGIEIVADEEKVKSTDYVWREDHADKH